jgi:lipopolysaccharide export system protein LptA
MRAYLGGVIGLAALVAVLPSAYGQDILQHGHGPINIDSENGIEWRREERLYIATGNAVAVRDDTTVKADTLIAHYREKPAAETGPDGKPLPAPPPVAATPGPDDKPAANSGTTASDIYQVDAIGNVVIYTPTELVVGEKAVYDVDKGYVVLTGSNLRLTTHNNQIVTARDSLEYWDQTKLAVARGNAVAVATDTQRRISGDVLSAYMVQDPKTNATSIDVVHAFGHVEVSNPSEIGVGDKGVYSMKKNLATLVGNVHLTHGQDQASGDYGDVDMNTGISRVLSGPSVGTAGQRVRALLVPKDAKDAKNATDAAQGSAPPAPPPKKGS